MNLKMLFPHALTVGNLGCGFLSIVSAVHGRLEVSAALIAIGAILDGLDGIVARSVSADSKFGAEFDSLADFVSFGVAPMVLIYSYSYSIFGIWAWILSAAYLIASAFRLVRFNLESETRYPEYYTGLPITSGGIMISGFVLFCLYVFGEIKMPLFLIAILVILTVLMVSRIRFNKFRIYGRNHPKWLKFLLSILFILPLIILPQVMIFLMIMAYVILVLSARTIETAKHLRAETDSR